MYFLHTITPPLAAAGLLLGQRQAPWNISAANLSISTPVPRVATGKQVVKILVGAAGELAFNPDSVSVTKGTILRFDFLGRNHSLTQSSFSHPCLNSSKFDSGFQQFNTLNVSGKFLVDFEVNSDDPQWFFCAQDSPQSHCGSGMVFSLNPDGKQSEFVSNARKGSDVLQGTSAPSTGLCPAHTLPTSTNHTISTRTSVLAQPSSTTMGLEVSNISDRLRLGLAGVMGGFLVGTFAAGF